MNDFPILIGFVGFTTGFVIACAIESYFYHKERKLHQKMVEELEASHTEFLKRLHAKLDRRKSILNEENSYVAATQEVPGLDAEVQQSIDGGTSHTNPGPDPRNQMDTGTENKC